MSHDLVHSEETIIQDYFAKLAAGYAGAYGLRDDCAVISVSDGCQLVVKTDPVRAGLHFFADDAPGDIAWKALAVNVSDLAAKTAKPLAYVMALSFPHRPESTWLAAFAQGLQQAQEAFGMHLIGGDTDRADGPLSIAITAFGTVPTGNMLQRATAQPGDLLFVSGSLGDAALGLQLRRDEKLGKSWGLSATQQQYLLARYHRPAPRIALRTALRSYASAAMDLSDGLAKDAGRLCKASKRGAEINYRDVPVSRQAAHVLERARDQRDAVLAAGDDYEILAAVPPTNAQAFCSAAALANVAVTQIGIMTPQRRIIIRDEDGAEIKLAHPGWDHF